MSTPNDSTKTAQPLDFALPIDRVEFDGIGRITAVHLRADHLHGSPALEGLGAWVALWNLRFHTLDSPLPFGTRMMLRRDIARTYGHAVEWDVAMFLRGGDSPPAAAVTAKARMTFFGHDAFDHESLVTYGGKIYMVDTEHCAFGIEGADKRRHLVHPLTWEGEQYLTWMSDGTEVAVTGRLASGLPLLVKATLYAREGSA